MKKEVLIAIFVGLSMGLIITFGIYRVRTSLTQTPTQNLAEIQEAVATATPTVLTLHSPEDGTIQTETETTVTGSTIANTFVVLFANEEDYITTSDESGNFSFQIELDQGVTVLRVHVLDDTGATSVEERLIVVSDAFEELEAAQAALEAMEATSSADASAEAEIN